jgi:spermidine synthase
MRIPHVALLTALFAGSGCAALIYEIVWFQLLELVIGSSGISLGMLLGTFMGGMCLGSLALPKLISPKLHPFRVFGLLEIGIAILGLTALFGMPHVGALYTNAGGGFHGPLMRGLICTLCLLPPALLMGATLPAIARWVEATPSGMSMLGLFYGGNIAGGLLGCLLAGFYLLRLYDTTAATYVAAAINLTTASIAIWAAGRTSYSPTANMAIDEVVLIERHWPIYLAIALSGLSALGAEVVWTRLLSLMLGPTVYAFSIILAVFLLGLAIGSGGGAAMARRSASPVRDLGYCQMLLSIAIAWSAFTLSGSLPYWPIFPVLSRSPWITFELDLVRCMIAILPAACLWGASFPLALASVTPRGQDSGRLASRVYAANTVGAIFGALIFSLVMIGAFGTHRAQQTLIGTALISGLLLLTRTSGPARRVEFGLAGATLAVLLLSTVDPIPAELVAYGRLLPMRLGLMAPSKPNIIYMGEGTNASVAVSETPDGTRSFHVSGKTEATNGPRDMRLQRIIGHLPAFYHNRPRSALIVGFGAGITAGTFVLHPDVERIVICEIEPLIPKMVSPYFVKENHNVLGDPRVELVYDDARHYLLTSGEKFDIITSDPMHPWVKGSAALYTREYFDLIKQHLNPGGLVSQWSPLYEIGVESVRSGMATFFKVFPDGTIWDNSTDGSGYDMVLLGGNGKLTINIDELQRRFDHPAYSSIANSLREVGFQSALDLHTTYAGHLTDVSPWFAHAEINHDRNLRLQYQAGMELNFTRESDIHDQIVAYRQFPKEFFIGTDDLKRRLQSSLGL